jgi:hypothetical protein
VRTLHRRLGILPKRKKLNWSGNIPKRLKLNWSGIIPQKTKFKLEWDYSSTGKY